MLFIAAKDYWLIFCDIYSTIPKAKTQIKSSQVKKAEIKPLVFVEFLIGLVAASPRFGEKEAITLINLADPAPHIVPSRVS